MHFFPGAGAKNSKGFVAQGLANDVSSYRLSVIKVFETASSAN
jgi:hypothetical protein